MESPILQEQPPSQEFRNVPNSENDYELMFENSPLAFLQIDDAGNILKFNSAAEIIFPSIRSESKKTNLMGLFPNEVQSNLKQMINQILEVDKPNSISSTIRITDDGTTIKYLKFIFTLITDSGKESNKLLVTAEDVTEFEEEKQYLKKHFEELQVVRDDLEERTSELAILNEKLRQSEMQLEEINQNKNRFFSIISHDLRSPFNSLLGLTKLILEDYDEFSRDEIKDSVYNLHQVSEGLYNLIEDLLDWSRIQFNHIEFQAETFNLNEMVNFVINSLKSVARDKNITVVNLVPKNCTIRADQHMINTIIRNLVGNAIKFTPKYGLVKISSGFDIDDIIISVEDTGVGMKKEIADRLFKMESKVSTSGTEGEAGTGLGLLICKEFVEKHGGKIWVKSEPEKGSSFFFRIPVQQEDE